MSETSTTAAVLQGRRADGTPIRTLTGHTDRVGKPAFNRRLALRRAQTVRQALLDLGVPEERIGRVEARCCIEDPPSVHPPARRTNLKLLIMRPTP